ncbi:MAG: FAD-dependent oxidoreductase [Bacteroidota bacterium]
MSIKISYEGEQIKSAKKIGADSNHVTIVGGGLAGLVAGLYLLRQGVQVTIYELTEILGGKAGARQNGSVYDEHGYHIFPMWYRNIWEMVEMLGLEHNFRDSTNFFQLKKGEYPKLHRLTNLASPAYILDNLTSGILPIDDMILFFYAGLDLLSEPLDRKAFLDQLSVNGFLKSRFYTNEQVARLFESSILGGSSAPSYQSSAMTYKNVLSYWFSHPLPMNKILKGDLNTFFIQPIVDRIKDLGGQIILQSEMIKINMADGKVRDINVRKTVTGEESTIDIDRLLLAMPVERIQDIVDDNLFAVDEKFGNYHILRTKPMAAFNVYLNFKMTDFPEDHVNLLGSKYSLSFIDVAQSWASYDKSVLNVIAANYLPLSSLSDEKAFELLFAEMKEFLPFLNKEQVEKVVFMSHKKEPLVLNDVGSWKFRPQARSKIKNLYIAGDYGRTAVDLITMEGAVSSGKEAAETIRSDMHVGNRIEVLSPDKPWSVLMRLAKYGLLPVITFAYISSRVRKEFKAAYV